MRWLRLAMAVAGLLCSGAATAAIVATLLPSAALGSFGYYGLLVAGSMPRVAVASIVGTVLGSLAGRQTQPRWIQTLAVTLGVGGALVSGTFAAAVVLKANAFGLPISSRWFSAVGNDERPAPAPDAVTLSSSDGTWHIDADLYRSAAANQQTTPGAIVVVHGGAWRHGDTGENPGSNQWLSEHGYVLLDIRYTLAPVADWRVPVKDVQCAVAWLRAHASELGIDPARVALLGRSAGGHLALLAAYLPDEENPCGPPPAAVIGFYPPTDLLQSYAESSGDSDLREGLRALLGTEPGTGDQTYRAASPLERVSARVPPTLLIHGTWDEPVPVDHSRRLAAALAARGADVQLVEMPFARHAFDIVPDGLHTLLAHEAISAFLEGRLANRR